MMATPDDEQVWVCQARTGDHLAYRLLVERTSLWTMSLTIVITV